MLKKHLNKVLFLSAVFCLISVHSATAQDYRIGLQNLYSRTVIYCYDNMNHSAEQCAAFYEKRGYTRLSDIPNRPAKYDFLTVDTFPTRRWRSNELAPRW